MAAPKLKTLVEKYYPESRFGEYSDVNATFLFYSRITALLEPHHTVLDVGCGDGIVARQGVPKIKELVNLKGKCREVIGLDVTPSGENNPGLHRFSCIQPNQPWPVDDASIDLCISQNMLEHVEDPEQFFSEAERVLKPGGFLCIRTPNVWSVFGIFSRAIPYKYHSRILQKDEEHTFRTYYRCNSRRKIGKMFSRHGFEGVVYYHDQEPRYLVFNKTLFRLGVLHQRYAPRFLSPILLAFARKN